ncbi:hypothetical protein VXS00_18810, partial [Photobacterium piscicola]|nr:hypothetical protein [Photobacterium piscicola]
ATKQPITPLVFFNLLIDFLHLWMVLQGFEGSMSIKPVNKRGKYGGKNRDEHPYFVHGKTRGYTG